MLEKNVSPVPKWKTGPCQPGSQKGWGRPLASSKAETPGRCWTGSRKHPGNKGGLLAAHYRLVTGLFFLEDQVALASTGGGTAWWKVWHVRAKRGDQTSQPPHAAPAGTTVPHAAQSPRARVGGSGERVSRGNLRGKGPPHRGLSWWPGCSPA